MALRRAGALGAAALVVAWVGGPSDACAGDPSVLHPVPDPVHDPVHDPVLDKARLGRLDKPHTLAEIDVGVLTLPASSLCSVSLGACLTADASLALGIRSLYRFDRFAIGAGVHYVISFQTEAAPGPPGSERTHERSYFVVESEFRYFPLLSRAIDVWVGGTAGVVVMADSWSTLADREPYSEADFIGPRALTLATVGGAAGLAAGLDWHFVDDWAVGATLRGGGWFFPDARQRTATGDVTSLAGPNLVLQAGLTLSYRLRL